MTKYLIRPAAAEYLTDKGLPTTKGTLQKLATVGGGPKYKIYGNKSVYTPENLDAYAEFKLRDPRGSTGDAA